MADDETRAFGQGIVDRRREPRHPIRLDVDYQHGDTYLYSRSSNLSEMGIFLVAERPPPPGTRIRLRFRLPGEPAALEIEGEVKWVDAGGPDREGGMGVRFIDPGDDFRAAIQTLIRTVAYLE
ncbi:MAG: TIGR02266 family protein [Polyangia bacterium]